MNNLIFLIIFLIFFSSQFDRNNGNVTINLNEKRQVIDGFGASTAWQGAVSDQTMNELFGTLGYSILRIRIDENKQWADELSNAKKALKFNAKVFASPWSAPANMKDNKQEKPGPLSSNQYSNYADYLKSFVDYFKNNGAPLYAISIINEPDFALEAPYNTMSFTPDQMKNFLKNSAKRIKSGSSTKIMATESYGYKTDMNDAILNDPQSAAAVDIIASHGYGFIMKPQPLVKKSGKQFWMTEHCIDAGDFNSVMKIAEHIHNSLTIAEFNAYVHWWLREPVPSKMMLLFFQNKQLTPKAYVIGQFAKFIRPGYFRVNSVSSNNNNLL
uniref:Glucosylceramidase n=1 Tax=Meloidogyne javanica TaxID=6303 RepID=A0A915LKP9_MELJA